ncbi:MAG: hypothetical protein WC342_08030 [Methanoregula sp.]|jgi:hypothetical protein
MQKIMCLAFCLLAGAFLGIAGCTSSDGAGSSAANVTTLVPAGSGSVATLEPLALTVSDVPAGFNLTAGREKSSTEVSQMALDIGWKGGYVIVFSKPGDSTANRTTITQTITLYNTINPGGILEVIRMSEQTTAGYDYANLSVSSTGNTAMAYEAIVNKTALTTTETPTPSTGMIIVPENPQDYREAAFVKGNYLDVIRIAGPDGTNAMLDSLAQKAYAKIP